ncbi:MAG TPA: shikimate kinase [Pyrinomonadaceae bacterium]|nr:shikimate kinase [Pyrinomonadaceae bacterium]
MKPIVITGFMGCGKSKVARELARHLNVLFVDLDEKITQREGRSPAQLIVEDGERAFRAIESNTLREVLNTKAAGVIALGGGAWIEEVNRVMVEQHGCTSVWLDVPFEVCWSRIETSVEDRPLGRTRSQALELYNRRRPIYQLANVRIEVRGDEFIDHLVTQIKSVLSA